MDELLVREIVHTVANLSAKVEEELGQIKRKIWNPREEERERDINKH